MSIQLDQAQRKAQASLRDIIATCVRELKQCTKDFDVDKLDLIRIQNSGRIRVGRLDPIGNIATHKVGAGLAQEGCPIDGTTTTAFVRFAHFAGAFP